MNPLKVLFYSSFISIFLLTMLNCSNENPVVSDGTPNLINTGSTDPTNIIDILVERPLHILSMPENSINKGVFIDANILDLYLSSGYKAEDFSITHLDGVDVGIIDRDAININLEDKTISGTITLKQRLDFENPIDTGENPRNNDYEVAIFQVMSETSSNDFKLIVRIIDMAAEPQKLEILIDSHHLDDIDQQRGLREIYLYEDSGAIAPILGDDSNNFLVSNLIEDVYVWGDVDATTDLSQLYDQNDKVDAFLTATSINSNSNTYHRLFFDFIKELHIQKIAVRGRQLGGYYGFVFILRNKDDHIISVHQASNPLSRGSGSEERATSTYTFVPDYTGFVIISNFDIHLYDDRFGISEGATNVIFINNFSVARGYEYERGFVNIEPGADFAKFNTDHLYFLDNELVGLSFKTAPSTEYKRDEDNNNIYELGMVTITNVDEGELAFNISVEVKSTNALLPFNAISYKVNLYTSNIIDDLIEIINASNFENGMSLDRDNYYYDLTGHDADHFKMVGNTLKTMEDFGFRNIFDNNGEHNLKVTYRPRHGGAVEELEIEVKVFPALHQINNRTPWGTRQGFQSVILENGDILMMGGTDDHYREDIWLSSDEGTNWREITHSAPWDIRQNFQAVVLTNNDILVIGGANSNYFTQNIWQSSDGGSNWSQIPAKNLFEDELGLNIRHDGRSSFQAVVLNNNDILVMGGVVYHYYSRPTNDIWRSSDGGTNWSQITTSAPWSARKDFQAVVLTNDDILIMGGYQWDHHSTNHPRINDIWRSSDGGTNWSQITTSAPWPARSLFQAVVLTNNDILIMGGKAQISGSHYYNDIWQSKDGGTNWTKAPQELTSWKSRENFQTILTLNHILIIGGVNAQGVHDDIWGLAMRNKNH